MVIFHRELVASLVVAAGVFVAGQVLAQNAPKDGNVYTAPDEWLLFSSGRPWWYQTDVVPGSPAPHTRAPTKDEQAIVDRARTLLNSRPARAIALLDGDSVIYAEYKPPADADSVFFGLSMGKTVTAMAVGQAICSGFLTFETKAGDVVPQLQGTALGKATVRDLLRMASGAAEPLDDTTIWTPEQFKNWNRGNLTILESVTEERVSKGARGFFSEYKPGEHFSYKATDPMVLGLMVTRATGKPFAYWVQETILSPMGAAKTGFIVQDRDGDAASDAGIRLRMEDWIRFAQWVKRSSKQTTCFGDFVRASQTTQMTNGIGPATRKVGKEFGGYGYLTWTDNATAANTAWARGAGGQEISWHRDSDRMLVVFAVSENWLSDVYQLARDWNQVTR